MLFWQAIGARCFDKGQFVQGSFDGNSITWGPIGWRKGTWVKKSQNKNKKVVETTEEDRKFGNKGHDGEDFEFSGLVYRDYECSKII